MTSTKPFPCTFCAGSYSTKACLIAHEKRKHPNNKIIPHLEHLPSPTIHESTQFRNALIVQIKKQLQFHRRSSRKKILKIVPFPEHLFIHFFSSESSFTYISSQRKYTCTFNGGNDSLQLGGILQNQDWNIKRNPQTGTAAYVLVEKCGKTYPITFCWQEQVYKEFGQVLTALSYGILKCSFYTDVRDFEVCNMVIIIILL